MAGLNKVILMGNLTKDPEYKTTPSGVGVTTFSVAVGRRFAKQGDEVTADFFNVVAWRNTATFMGNHFTKGRPMIVSGRLQIRKWQDKDGNNRTTAEVVADNVYFADSKRYGQNFGVIDSGAELPLLLDDDDLPF